MSCLTNSEKVSTNVDAISTCSLSGTHDRQVAHTRSSASCACASQGAASRSSERISCSVHGENLAGILYQSVPATKPRGSKCNAFRQFAFDVQTSCQLMLGAPRSTLRFLELRKSLWLTQWTVVQFSQERRMYCWRFLRTSSFRHCSQNARRPFWGSNREASDGNGRFSEGIALHALIKALTWSLKFRSNPGREFLVEYPRESLRNQLGKFGETRCEIPILRARCLL
jgi:hypothetical protein